MKGEEERGGEGKAISWQYRVMMLYLKWAWHCRQGAALSQGGRPPSYLPAGEGEGGRRRERERERVARGRRRRSLTH